MNLTAKLPPQNLEAEQGTLGSILLDNASLDEIALGLRPEHFYRDAHQAIYRSILRLYGNGTPVDAVTLYDELVRSGDDQSVGRTPNDVVDYIAQVINSVPHAVNGRYYAQVVHQKAVSRNILLACEESLAEVYSNAHTAEELLDLLERRVFGLGDEGRPQTSVSAGFAVRAAMDRLDARNGAFQGLTTGWSELDQLTDGLQPGQLIVMAGRPSMGKTTAALNLADWIACEQGYPALYCCCEMGHVELGERLLVSRSRVPNHYFKNPGLLQTRHYHELGNASQELSTAPLELEDTSIQSVTRIAASARRLKRRHGKLGAVFVDYLQLVSSPDPRVPRQEQVAQMSRAFKILARDLACPVIVLSQLNRENEKREDRKPKMSDLRESGAIEQDADMVLLLHRPEYYDANDRPGIIEFIVAKNRNGATRTINLSWRPHVYRVDELLAPDLSGGADLPPPAHGYVKAADESIDDGPVGGGDEAAF